MLLLKQFKFEDRFAGDNFLKILSVKEYKEIYTSQIEILHTHNYYFFMYVTEGSGKHYINFKEYPIHDNALYFLAPGQVHYLNSSLDTDGYILVFEEHFFCAGIHKNEILLSPPFFRNGLVTPYIRLAELNQEYMLALFRRIKSEYENDEVTKWEITRGILHILINRIESISLPPATSENSKYKRAFKVLNGFRNLVEQHYSTEKHIAFYAAKLHITPNHLSETIREVTGETPVDSIRRRTLLEAKRRLLANEGSIKELAYQLGYDNVSYFIKLFKVETGLTPTEFRLKAVKS